MPLPDRRRARYARRGARGDRGRRRVSDTDHGGRRRGAGTQRGKHAPGLGRQSADRLQEHAAAFGYISSREAYQLLPGGVSTAPARQEERAAAPLAAAAVVDHRRRYRGSHRSQYRGDAFSGHSPTPTQSPAGLMSSAAASSASGRGAPACLAPPQRLPPSARPRPPQRTHIVIVPGLVHAGEHARKHPRVQADEHRYCSLCSATLGLRRYKTPARLVLAAASACGASARPPWPTRRCCSGRAVPGGSATGHARNDVGGGPWTRLRQSRLK